MRRDRFDLQQIENLATGVAGVLGDRRKERAPARTAHALISSTDSTP